MTGMSNDADAEQESLAHLADENVDGLNGVASVGRRLAGIALAALRVGTPGLDGWRRPEHRRVAQCHFEICDPLGQAVTEERSNPSDSNR